MTIPSHTTTQTTSLISTGISIPPIDEMRDEFNEYFVVSIGEYWYNKGDRSMVKKGRKRNMDHSDMDMYVAKEVVWIQRSSDPHEYASDATFVLRDFTGSNFDVVNTLNREFVNIKQKLLD